MKIEFEMKYPFGTKFYGVKSEAKNLYAPCPVCGNTRKVKAVGIDKSEHDFDCYRCTGQVTKGDKSLVHIMQIFTVAEDTIAQINCTQKGIYPSCYKGKNLTLQEFESSVKNTDNIFDYCKRYGEAYTWNLGEQNTTTDLTHIKALVDAINKSEREKARAFEKEHKLV